MTTLAVQQADFLRQVLDEDASLPPGWNARQAAGIAIYRGAYRSTMVEALGEMYERTARWTGPGAFRSAAIHHVVDHPPASWTIDEVGRGFPVTLAQLFGDNPEVAELGWLEWAMHSAYIAADREPLSPGRFAQATRQFGDDEWTGLTLRFVPAFDHRAVLHDLSAMWHATADDMGVHPQTTLDKPRHCLVWREGYRATFQLVDAAQGEGATLLQHGGSFGDLCAFLTRRMGETQGIVAAGQMLARWLESGLIGAIGR